jgi:hypothetical protein
MAYEIDFKQMLVELRPEGSRLTYFGACVLTHYFLSLTEIKELTAEQELGMIINAVCRYDEEIATRQETLDDEEMKIKYQKHHDDLQEVQDDAIAQKLSDVFPDCVQRQKYLLLYAINQSLPLEGSSETILQNFENFLQSSELTEDEGREMLLLIEQVSLENGIEQPDYEAIKNAQISDPENIPSSAEEGIKTNFQNDQFLSGEGPSSLKNIKGYGLN